MIVAGKTVGRIGRGFAVLLGVARDDTRADAEFIADRIVGLRVFADQAGKMNLALSAVGGELLVVQVGVRIDEDSHVRSRSLEVARRPAPPTEADAGA